LKGSLWVFGMDEAWWETVTADVVVG
jgi:hypothetical protein